MDNTLLFRADSVLKADVGSDDQRADLLSQIKKAQETTPNAYSSNIGCYRNTVKYENLDWLLDVVKDTTDEFLDFYKTLCLKN
jgi:predicted site-specific integrase-resolvase